MKQGARPADDATGDAATGNLAGDLVLNSVLAVLTDELDQVLVLTHLALGIPLAPLARDLRRSQQELRARLADIRAELSQHAELSRLRSVRRAGQIEHYYPIIVRLGLQNWFCACPGCTNLIIQSKTGSPRKTCSGRCRTRLHRQQRITWNDRNYGESSRNPDMVADQNHGIEDVSATRDFILQLMRPINYPQPRTYWHQPNIHCRDRALLLLGFTCPRPVTVLDLGELDIDDVGEASEAGVCQSRRRCLAR